MIPILYDENEQSFTSEGLCRLTDATRCIVTEELNGIYNLELDYPISGLNYEEITEGRIIGVIHDDRKDVQPFDIVGRSAPIEGVVTFYAQHISYRLGQLVVKPFTASSITEAMGKLAAEAMIQSPFTYWTDKSVASTYQVSSPSAIRSLLGGSSGSLLDVYGKGEYEFDKWAVKLYINRGADNGVEIRYGKNLVDLEYKTDISENYNAVAPFWTKDGSTVVLPEGYIVRTGSTGRVKVIPLDLSDSFEDAPTVAELRTLATARLENSEAWVMDENITVDFIQLWQTEDYKDVAALERVALGDKVAVVHPVLGLAVNRIEVVKVEYDALEERYTSMELGKKKTSFAEAIMERTKEDVLEIVPDKETMQDAIDYATEMITGVNGGNVVINRDANGRPYELLIMDADNKADAVNVWRWNLNGLGHSHSGYNGPYNDIALTADGKINASMITTGILQAIKIINGNNTFVVESDGRVTASAINITGGSIKISTNTDTYDVIELSYTNSNGYTTKAQYSPLQVRLDGFDADAGMATRTLLAQGGAVFLYRSGNQLVAYGADSASFKYSTGQQANIYGSSAASTYADGIRRGLFTGASLYLYDTSGIARSRLLDTGLTLYDSAGSVKSIYDLQGVRVYDSDGKVRAKYYQNAIYQDASETTIANYGENANFYNSGKLRAQLAYNGLYLRDSDGKQRTSVQPLLIIIKDSAEVERMRLTGTSLYLKNASGVTRFQLQAATAQFFDDNSNELMLLNTDTLRFKTADGTQRVYINTAYGVGVYNSSGSQTAGMSPNGFNITNDSTHGVLIDGAGFTNTNGRWEWKAVRATDNTICYVPAYVPN